MEKELTKLAKQKPAAEPAIRPAKPPFRSGPLLPAVRKEPAKREATAAADLARDAPVLRAGVQYRDAATQTASRFGTERVVKSLDAPVQKKKTVSILTL